MWRNFRHTEILDVENVRCADILDVEKFQINGLNFLFTTDDECVILCPVAIYAVLSQNQFFAIYAILSQNLLCCNLRIFYVEKNWAQNVVRGEKMTNIMYDYICLKDASIS